VNPTFGHTANDEAPEPAAAPGWRPLVLREARGRPDGRRVGAAFEADRAVSGCVAALSYLVGCAVGGWGAWSGVVCGQG